MRNKNLCGILTQTLNLEKLEKQKIVNYKLKKTTFANTV